MFLNISEKSHQFLLVLKEKHTKENRFLFSASHGVEYPWPVECMIRRLGASVLGYIVLVPASSLL